VVLVEPKRLELRTYALPEIGEDDALLALEACGMCGTDYEQFAGDVRKHAYYTPYPAIIGHEPLGRIARIGPLARERWGVEVGDRVAVRTGYGCGTCEACQGGTPGRCLNRGGTYGLTDVGKPPHLWGGYADYMYLSPYSAMEKMNPALRPEVAVLFNPLAAGFSWAVSVPKTLPGETVVVLGPGQRGLCSVVAAREAGASKVIVTGLSRDAHKLALARQFGADLAIDVEREDAVALVLEATDGGADVVVDTTPMAPEALAQAIGMARRRGRIVLAGLKGPRPSLGVYADDIIYKELRIIGTLSTNYDDFVRAVKVVDSGKYPLEHMHTHAFPLEQAEEAILTLAGRYPERNAIQVAIVP